TSAHLPPVGKLQVSTPAHLSNQDGKHASDIAERETSLLRIGWYRAARAPLKFGRRTPATPARARSHSDGTEALPPFRGRPPDQYIPTIQFVLPNLTGVRQPLKKRLLLRAV